MTPRDWNDIKACAMARLPWLTTDEAEAQAIGL